MRALAQGGTGGEPASVWQTMPRTLVDAAPMTGLHVAAAAAAPYAAQLAAAAAPLRSASAEVLPFAEAGDASEAADDDGWLDAPERRTPAPILSMPKASHVAMPEPPPARLPKAGGVAADAFADAGHCGAEHCVRQARGCGHQAGGDYAEVDSRI